MFVSIKLLSSRYRVSYPFSHVLRAAGQVGLETQPDKARQSTGNLHFCAWTVRATPRIISKDPNCIVKMAE